jgi:calcium-dependent protein kinase
MRGQAANSALKNMANFDPNNKLKQATLAFIAGQLLTKEEKTETDKVFRAMDVNGTGILSKQELKEGYLNYYGTVMSDEEIDRMFDAVDTDGSGEIEYSEFVVATLGEKVLFTPAKLK